MNTVENLQAATEAIEDGLRNATSRDEYIRWQSALGHLLLIIEPEDCD